jgi:hypothetical protein
VVEVQWGIAPRYLAPPVDHAGLWARAVRIALGGRAVPSLAPEDLLLVLTTHGAKHLWRRIAWVCDVAELVRSAPGLDWALIEAEARRLGTRRMLRLGLALARDALGAALPAPAAGWLHGDRAVASLSARVLAGWSGAAPTWPGLLESAWFHLRARERRRDRVRYCAGLALATTPGDWSVLDLPRSLFPLYYPVRMVRLAAKYGGLARRRPATGRGPA